MDESSLSHKYYGSYAKDAVFAGEPEKANEQLEEFIEGIKNSSVKELLLIWVEEYKKRYCTA